MEVSPGVVEAVHATRAALTTILASLAASFVSAQPVQTDRVLPAGPWGHVELVPIQIRLPATMVPDFPMTVQPWIVERGKQQTAQLLEDVGIDSELAHRLLSTYERSSGGTLRPTSDMIRALDRSSRSRLYEVLHSHLANGSQRTPHRIRRARLEVRFRDLSPVTVELVQEFLYERENLPQSLFLADLPSVLELTVDGAERARLIQAISERESVLMRLKLDHASNPFLLADYWGRGGRRRDLEILVSSLADDPTARQIDVIYLLPPFARGFLLTYPQIGNAADRDCFWTVLNFFRSVPDDGLVGPKVDRALAEDYTYVEGPLQLGDVLVLWRPTGEAEHAAVFIAGDIYFTKNGTSLATPWVFMPLADILENYDEAEHTPLTHYRLKNLD